MMQRSKQDVLLRRLRLQAMNRLAAGGIPETDVESLANQLADHAEREFETSARILNSTEIVKLKGRMIELTNPHIDVADRDLDNYLTKD